MLHLALSCIHLATSYIYSLVAFILSRPIGLLLTYAIYILAGVFDKQEEFKMNLVEKLLAMDAGKVEIPTKIITIQSEKLNELLEFPCKAIDPEKFAEIQENSIVMKKGDFKKVETYKLKTMVIIEGCPDVFKSKEVAEHFKAASPRDLIRKLLLSGEIEDLYNGICELSGYNKDKEDEDEEELKNSSEKIEVSN